MTKRLFRVTLYRYWDGERVKVFETEVQVDGDSLPVGIGKATLLAERQWVRAKRRQGEATPIDYTTAEVTVLRAGDANR